MGQTVQQIEAQIDETRDRLGADIRELWREIDGLVDWRRHYRQRPLLFLGAALAGGAALAVATSSSPRQLRIGSPEGARGSSAPNEMTRAFEIGKNALIGLAAQRLMQYVGELIPGFEEHVDRARRQSSTGVDSQSRL